MGEDWPSIFDSACEGDGSAAVGVGGVASLPISFSCGMSLLSLLSFSLLTGASFSSSSLSESSEHSSSIPNLQYHMINQV